tara:strand:- start:1545 stop:1823 length:279 start_codon:yes stop_codon:yes gene_type:complete
MSKNLYCPKCKTEYWGEVNIKDTWNDYKNDCSCGCGYIFTLKDFEKAKGVSEEKNFLKDLQSIIKKHTKNTVIDAHFHIRDDFNKLKEKYML